MMKIITIRQGKVITKKLDGDKVDCVRLYDEQAQFIGLGEFNTDGELRAKRLLAF